MSELHRMVSDHGEQLAEHRIDIQNIKQKLLEHAGALDELRETDMHILERLGKSATHEDIVDLHSKIDGSVNGLLKDALNAVPEKYANSNARRQTIWLMIAALTSFAALVLTYIHSGAPH